MRKICSGILIFCCLVFNRSRAEGEDKSNLTLVQVVSIVDKTPIENISALFYSKGKMFFRDESDADGYLLSPPKSNFDSVIIYSPSNLFYKMRLRSGELTNYIFVKPKINQMDVVTISTPGMFNENKFNSQYVVNVIGEEELKKKSAMTLNDALRNYNTIRLNQDAILGTKVSLGGMSSSNQKILLDGVPIVGKQDGSIDISQINIANIAKIEVVEGPMAVLYGSNATGGIINLISKKKISERWAITLQSHTESIGQYNLNLHMGFNVKKHQFMFSGGRNAFLGWDPNLDSFKKMDPQPRDVLWNPKEQIFGNFSYLLPFNKNHNLHFKFDVLNERILNRQNPTSVYTINAIDDWYTTRRYITSLHYSGKVLHDLTVESNGSLTQYFRDFEQNYKNLTDGTITSFQNTSDQINSIFNRTILTYNKFNDKIKLVGGYEFNYDMAKGLRLKDGNQSITDLGIMLSLNYKPNNIISVQPGVRYSINSKFFTPFAPSINLKINPEKNVVLRASYARAYVAPDIKELFFEFKDFNHNIVGNPKLNVETSNNMQVGLEYKKQKEESTKYYNASFNISYSDKTDAIALAIVNPALLEFQYQNIGRLKTLNYSANANFNYNQLNITTGAAAIGNLRSFENQAADPNFNKFLFSPEFTINLNYQEPKSKITFSMFNKYNGKLSFLNINQATQVQEITTQSAYTISDLTMSRSFWKDQIFINLGARNLWDIKNLFQTGTGGSFHNSGNPAILWGRTFFINVKITLKQKANTDNKNADKNEK